MRRPFRHPSGADGENGVENGQEGVLKTMNFKVNTLPGQDMTLDFKSISVQTMRSMAGRCLAS
jgi:hypothetical protein